MGKRAINGEKSDPTMKQPVSTTVVRALRDLAEDAPLELRVSGQCMAPLLESGAMIQVIRQSFYWPGDPVVIHAADGRLLSHRLLGFYPRARRLRWLTRALKVSRPLIGYTKYY